jgi:hypothetical protein
MYEAILDVLHDAKTKILKSNIHWCILQVSGAIVALRSSGIYVEGLPIRYENSQLPTPHLFFHVNQATRSNNCYFIFSGSALQRHPSGSAYNKPRRETNRLVPLSGLTYLRLRE